MATVWYEAQLARERINGVLATQAMLQDAVIKAVLSPAGKGGQRHLKKLLQDLTSG